MTPRALLRKLFRDERGTSAVEYAIICACIMFAIFTAAQSVADATIGMWQDVKDKSSEAIGK